MSEPTAECRICYGQIRFVKREGWTHVGPAARANRGHRPSVVIANKREDA